MIDAGVTLFGKTNVPLKLGRLAELQRGLRHDQQSRGTSARTPGGSSGGSAAALAAGLTGLEAGSDIGASIRNPAHYCGVFGHKPTWGVVSPRAMRCPAPSRRPTSAWCGPLARGAEDLEIAMDAMAGPDAIDGRGWTLTLPRRRRRSCATSRSP